MIEVGLQYGGPPVYRCRSCRRLMHLELGRHGSRCPSCDTGILENVVRVTRRMLEQHERAR